MAENQSSKKSLRAEQSNIGDKGKVNPALSGGERDMNLF